ncbi:TonB-dependent receptor plug domain-containing protein [Rufibacter latericius]|uniref:Macroglobulin domain-containing protein n=1 Tax=Rufibacter latericius TaxID=2487040 RepID=A0A3M9MAG8_9BACT|nr:TonB-dependent receptor plug domain-containing protein [Rufibacter latericius]RNI22541.1 hypothetical protein EFB08_20800 [Rufibacter latericius]
MKTILSRFTVFRRAGLSAMVGLCLFHGAISNVQGQSTSTASTRLKDHQSKAVQEKMFLHLDRTSYATGDIMWFKVYNVDGTRHKPLDMSKVAYIEVVNASRKPVLQGKIELKEGVGNGSFVLPVSLKAGHYMVRGYTNWMKNFGPEFYFEQPVTIINTFQALGLTPAPDTAAYSIRFFPEGGNLVSGLPSKVAFKAINSKTGKGTSCQGKILDSAGKVVTTFQPTKYGIGTFNLPPAEEEYTALVTFPSGKEVRQKLPIIQKTGYNLYLTENKPGELQITSNSTNQQAEQVLLLGHTRQTVVVASTAIMANGKATFTVLKDSLLDGITHFTLFNSQQRPVSERLFFKRPIKQLEIAATLNKAQFGLREKVSVDLLTQADKAGAANLSMAVFKADHLQNAEQVDISTYLYLTSDLKGTVENPSSYLTETGSQADEALDNLMLTQGWNRFTWDEVLNPEALTFPFVPEYQGHLITGLITHNSTGAPAKDIRAFLASPGKNTRFYTGFSSKNGTVLFDVKDFFGPKEVVMQTNFLKDSTYHFKISDPFSKRFSTTELPTFDLPESLREAIHLRHLDVQAQNIYFEQFLNRYTAPAIDSLPFFGKSSKKYLLDDYTRFKVMEEVMREYVPGVLVRKRRDGFHFMVLDGARKLVFQENPLVLLDGVPVFDIDQIMAFDPLKIQKLEVIESQYFNGSLASNGVVSYTTYKGDLAGFPLDTRALLQEYEGLQLQREFYAPAYETEEQKLSRLPDWRNLLYWAPNISTDKDGKATTSFYTSDQPGIYTIVVQGLTKDGLPGSKMVTFEVKKPL